MNEGHNFFSRILVALLAMLGISCGGAKLYGTPYVDYALNVHVLDEAGNPIQNASVFTRNGDADNPETSKWQNEPIKSNSNGLASGYMVDPYWRTVDIKVKAEGYVTDSIKMENTNVSNPRAKTDLEAVFHLKKEQ